MAEAPGAPSGGVSELIVSTDKGLSQLAAMAASSGAMPEGIAERLGAVRAEFQAIIDELTSGGGAPAPQAGGVAAPEAGGNPNAVPQSMGRAR